MRSRMRCLNIYNNGYYQDISFLIVYHISKKVGSYLNCTLESIWVGVLQTTLFEQLITSLLLVRTNWQTCTYVRTYFKDNFEGKICTNKVPKRALLTKSIKSLILVSWNLLCLRCLHWIWFWCVSVRLFGRTLWIPKSIKVLWKYLNN